MAVFKCKMCGGNLDIEKGVTVYECEYCGTKQTVPSADNEKKMILFGRANRLRFACEFDKAAGVYESIVADFPEEAEAYWGLVLCKYGIEYVDDPATAKKIPTCHRSSFESVLDDSNFEQVMENADAVARGVYRDEAKQIEELRKGIIEVSSKEEPYDIFICYKETDENGDRTIDSVIAQDVYTELVNKGYRVFFSRITLEDKLGQEYEPYIFAALNSAKIMLAFGTDYEYYNAVWVKNEWSRFLQLITKGEKKTLIPCYKDIDAYDMPKEFAKLQAQDMGKVGAIQDLIRGIEKIIKADSKSAGSQTHFREKRNLLEDAFSLIEDGNFKTAEKYCDEVLKTEPQNAKAYLAKLMAQLKVKEFNAKSFMHKKYVKNENYLKAIEYGDDQIKEKFESFAAYEKNFKKKIGIIFSAVTIPTLLLVVTINFLIIRQNYDECVNSLKSGLGNYQQLEYEFSKMYGYKKSEYYEALCGAKEGKVYEEVYELEYDKSFRGISIQDSFPNVKTILVSNDVTIVNNSPFEGCTSVENIILPENMKEICASAFKNCTSLKSITIPDGVVTIHEKAFKNCSALESITISKRVTSIPANAFVNCSSLKEIKIPDSVTEISRNAFDGCSALESITLPSSVTEIGVGAFRNCSALKNIIIPNSVQKISSSAFSGCSFLESITIPNSVYEMGYNVFSDCSSLKTIYCEENGPKLNWKSDWAVKTPGLEIVYGAKK